MHRLIALAFIALTAADRFNYDQTAGNNYGPSDWLKVTCSDVETCPGWPTNWEEVNPFIPYDEATNECFDCSSSDNGECRGHMQSPIYLNKNVALERDCRDRHRMNIVKGNCAYSDLRFEILPHVLRVHQPESCGVPAEIDFSRGYPIPWLLSFTDISVPSQHVIDGQRYDAELVLSHKYARDIDERFIGNVAVFFQVGNETTAYDLLDLYLERWEEVAAEIVANCTASGTAETDAPSDMPSDAPSDAPSMAPSVESIARRGLRSSASQKSRRMISTNAEVSNYIGRDYHPYDFYRMTKTEYYFRYLGSTAEPPCFAGVHWRVLKDPVQISPLQLQRMKDLLAKRLNPETCQAETAAKVVPNPNGPDDVFVNRPLQTTTRMHQLVFCECTDWDSRTAEDVEWCENTSYSVRLGLPTEAPSTSPSLMPSDAPSDVPSAVPSMAPSVAPSLAPSVAPSVEPSAVPSISPTASLAPTASKAPINFAGSTDGDTAVGRSKKQKAVIGTVVVVACVAIAAFFATAYFMKKNAAPVA